MHLASGSGLFLGLLPWCDCSVLWGKLKLIHKVRLGIFLRNGFSSNTSELIGILVSFKSLSQSFILLLFLYFRGNYNTNMSPAAFRELRRNLVVSYSRTHRSQLLSGFGGWGRLPIVLSAAERRDNGTMHGIENFLWSPICFLSAEWVSPLAHRTIPTRKRRHHLRWERESLE